MEFSFESWRERQDNAQLHEAWRASREFARQLDRQPLIAFCPLCGANHSFALIRPQALSSDLDLREQLACSNCGCNTRQRAALVPVKQLLESRPTASVYVTEQVTPVYVWLQRALTGRAFGSEFQPSFRRRCRLSWILRQIGGRGWVHFQDITRTTFSNAKFDAVACFEVLEHIPAFEAAISEFARILKPDGLCVATFPFTEGPKTITRARLTAAGETEHLLPAEYHGDPLGTGILCFHHFGWDIVDAFKNAGFSEAAMVMNYDLDQALPYGQWTLVARR